MRVRTKRWMIVTILSVAAFAIAGGAALAGGTAARGIAAAKPPVAGMACTKAGGTGTAKGGVKLVCTKNAKKKLVWVAVKPAKPATRAVPAKRAVPPTPAKPASPTSPAPSGGVADANLIAQGKGYYLNGVGTQAIACARCHGMNALGDTAPKVTGKNATQIRTAIQSVAVMAPFFGDVSNDQIEAIAAYLKSLG